MDRYWSKIDKLTEYLNQNDFENVLRDSVTIEFVET